MKSLLLKMVFLLSMSALFPVASFAATDAATEKTQNLALEETCHPCTCGSDGPRRCICCPNREPIPQ